MPKGTCSLEEFSARLAAGTAARDGNAQGNSTALSQREIIDKEIAITEQLSRNLGLWIPMEETPHLGIPFPCGVENTVYYDSHTDKVYNVNNLITSKSIGNFICRMLQHNALFPQTAYELVGFTGFGKSSVYPVVCQDYIPNATYATHGEILDYMESLGFQASGDATFTNGSIIINDLRPRNVLKTPNGALFVIDADFKF